MRTTSLLFAAVVLGVVAFSGLRAVAADGSDGNSAAVSSTTASGETSSLGSLSGTVVDPDGKPVSGARVSVDTYDKKRLAEARTDSSGRFRRGPIEPVYRHCFPIFIDAEGFAQQYVRPEAYSVFPGVDSDLGQIRVDRGRVFIGQVFDTDGQPRPGLEVRCRVWRLCRGHSAGPITPTYSMTTDSTGRYRTPPLPVGELGVSASPPGRVSAVQARYVEPGGEETLAPFRLEPETPIHGTVKDALGKPIAGAKLHDATEDGAISDAEGRFTLHGFAPPPRRFQLVVIVNDSVFADWGVHVTKDGIYWHEAGDESRNEHGPFKELPVTPRPQAWIEGRAIDAETGEPVRLNRVVLCFFERKDGEAVLSGCRSPRFEQLEGGRFRVPYRSPDEYHLTLSADGYHDAEAFTPKVTELKPIEGIVVKLRKNKADTAPTVAKQTISGRVTRDGKPVQVGWVGLWRLARQSDAINVPILRGRTVVGDPLAADETLIENGKYALEPRYQDDAWYVAVEEPGHALTLVGPINLALNEKKTLDIACIEGGGIRGRVTNVPDAWKGHLWVIAFSKTAIQEETRVAPGGRFAFSRLPPGEYGLKVGHDACRDTEVAEYDTDSLAAYLEAKKKKADPWQRAKVVTVEPGREVTGVELELPR